MRIAVEGCAHGELDRIYETIEELQKVGNVKIDLLICCGDFQSIRNATDLESMAAPAKYKSIGTFHKYYTGQAKAPLLTVFIGGNHESSQYLQELSYGGWVAPNIYYMGTAGVIDIAGIRIGGISGIFKGRDYHRGRFEMPPYSENMKRSIYHIRNLDVFRLKQLSSPIDIFLSHDWPLGIYNYGNAEQLIRFKPFFRQEISDNTLGSPPCEELLNRLKPKFWFSAHLHVKFAVIVPHKNESNDVIGETKFLALDKCLPNRHFLQVLELETKPEVEVKIKYDLEWLSILHNTNHLISVLQSMNYLPDGKSLSSTDERTDFRPTEKEKQFISDKFGDLNVPDNFAVTAPGHSDDRNLSDFGRIYMNPQTTEFCRKLGVDDPLQLVSERPNQQNETSSTLDYSQFSSFCSETDASESTKEVAPKRTSLSLPEPKFDSEQPDKVEPHQEPAPGLFIIDDGTKNVEEAPVQYGKKFKRRNQSIYQSEE